MQNQRDNSGLEEFSDKPDNKCTKQTYKIIVVMGK